MDNYKDTGRIKQIRSQGPFGREIIVHKGHGGQNNFHQVPCFRSLGLTREALQTVCSSFGFFYYTICFY